MRRVLDSNVLLYHVHGALAAPLPEGEYFVSFITRIEVLSFPNLLPAEENAIRQYLDEVTVLNIDEDIEAETIRLRRTLRLRMADAIIVATAAVTGSELLTHDSVLLKVPGIKTSAPALKHT